MYKAEKYSGFNGLQRYYTQQLLGKSMKLMEFKASDVVVDLGCGIGDATKGILLQQIPTCERLIGVDISSEMLDFARAHNSHSKVEYAHLDLVSERIPAQFVDRFDHAFSFFVFHWPCNQKQLYENIFKMMKPGGDLLAVFIFKCDLKLIYQQLVSSSKWREYLPNGTYLNFPFQNNDQDVVDLEANVEKAGFAHLIRVEKTTYVYDSIDQYRTAMEVVMPFMKCIPTHRQNELMNEFMQLSVDFEFVSKPISPQSTALLRFDSAVMYLRKPPKLPTY